MSFLFWLAPFFPRQPVWNGCQTKGFHKKITKTQANNVSRSHKHLGIGYTSHNGEPKQVRWCFGAVVQSYAAPSFGTPSLRQISSECLPQADHRWRTGGLQSRKEYHGADLRPTNPMWEISPAPARPLPCLRRLQEGLRQGLAWNFVSNHEEVQHQRQPYPCIKNLYDKATSAVLSNSSRGDWCRLLLSNSKTSSNDWTASYVLQQVNCEYNTTFILFAIG